MLDRPTVHSGHAEDIERESKGFLWRTLDAVEDCLLRMIVGIFKFAFYRLPKLAWQTIENWFPTLIKLIKVSALLSVWIIILIGPLFYIYYTWYGITLHSIDMKAEFDNVLAMYGPWPLAWVGLAVLGSFWGLVYVRRETWKWWRRRQERNSGPWGEETSA